MSIETAREELAWIKKTATDEKDRCRVVGYDSDAHRQKWNKYCEQYEKDIAA